MEPQHQQQNGEDIIDNNNDNHEYSNNNNTNKSNFLCRQSSSRWTPTSDQIRILKDLYYNNGIRSPSAEQIQKISARLRQYGKIEGKNVFYWFQNHKARERQKKRFNTTSNIAGVDFPSVAYKYPTITPAGFPSSSSACSSPGVVGVGSYAYGYGSVTMEKSFRDCSISAGGGTLAGHNMWVGDQNPYSSSSYHHFIDHQQRKLIQFEDIQEDDQNVDMVDHYHEERLHEIETLPLFSLSSGGFFKPDAESCHASTWHHFPGSDHMACSRSTSLELSLNSYTGRY